MSMEAAVCVRQHTIERAPTSGGSREALVGIAGASLSVGGRYEG